MDDIDRDAILSRRALLLGAAVGAIGCTARPGPCLAVAVNPCGHGEYTYRRGIQIAFAEGDATLDPTAQAQLSQYVDTLRRMPERVAGVALLYRDTSDLGMQRKLAVSHALPALGIPQNIVLNIHGDYAAIPNDGAEGAVAVWARVCLEP